MKVNTVTYADLTGTHARQNARSYSEPAEFDVFALFAARPGWMADAACKGMETNHWFPSRGDSRMESTVAAKAVCGRCPVRKECLAHALSPPREHHGIWAGLSERQRRFLTRDKVA